MIYILSSKDIIGIHERMITASGGTAGYADRGRIESMATRILKCNMYEGEDGIYVMAAAYLLAIARGHCFNDANKKTVFSSSALFLHRNGIIVRFYEELTVSAVQGSLDVCNIAEALKQST